MSRIFLILFVFLSLSAASSCGLSYDSGDSSDDDNSHNSSNVITDNSIVGGDDEGEFRQCDGLTFPDGPEFGSNLWEPEGSDDGTAVIRFDARRFVEIFAAVKADVIVEEIDRFGEIVERIETEFFVGRVERDDQGRQVWVGSLPGESYTGDIEIELDDGRSCSLTIETPGEIVD